MIMASVLVYSLILLSVMHFVSVQSGPVRFTDLDDDDDLDETIIRGAVNIGREIGGIFFGLVRPA